MQKIKGTYASAVIYSDTAEDYALAQVKMICDNEAAAGSKICLMPDVHPGKVGPIGLTMTIGERILPSLLGADIGCGVVALLPLASISTAHIRHPRERFAMGQRIFAVVQEIDRAARRITLSHKELLGTWLENAADFRPGDTVTGILRGKHPYGQFVELTPNLSGLTDTPQALPEGSAVSVRIRSIQPERQKIRLQVIRVLGPAAFPTPLPYRITGGSVRGWRYTQEPPWISSQ